MEYAGALYHVACRMVGSWRTDRARLFADEADYERFLEALSDRVSRFGVRLYLFACMSNHFHLVFETPGANCSAFMQSLATSYTVYYNLRHRRHGHLLDGRFKAKLVAGDEHLLRLSRYVHLNPVRTKAWRSRPLEAQVEGLREYRWSSYPGYVDPSKKLDVVEAGPLLGLVGGAASSRPRRYGEYVEAGLAEADDAFEAVLRESPLCIGDAAFQAEVDRRYDGRVRTVRRPEDASFRRKRLALPPERVLAVLAGALGVAPEAFERRGRHSPLRALAVRFLVRHAGQSQRAAAERLGMGSGSAACRQLAAAEGWLERGSALRSAVAKAERQLAAASAEEGNLA
jgi:REP element-mobilizing transposase RayT